MGYWRTQLERFKTHIAERDVESFFLQSGENSRQMRTTYTVLGNVESFIEWLEHMAASEDAGMGSGSVFTMIGGVK